MLKRTIPVAVIAVLLLMLAACSEATPAPSPTSNPTPTAAPTETPAAAPTPTPTPVPTTTASPYTGYLTEEIPPCTPVAGASVDPCEPRPPIETFGSLGGTSPASYTDDPLTIRQFLDGSSLTYIPHIVLRGVYVPGTVRCTSGDPYRTASWVEPGYTQHSILINCYADVRVNGYILGEGPPQLTVLVDFHHYWHGYYAQGAAETDMTEAEFVEFARGTYELILEEGFDPALGGIYGREVVLFVGPGHSHAHEVWEVFETWDVQQHGDSPAFVVHPHRDDWRIRPDKYSEHLHRLEMYLPRFQEVVAAAHQARVAEYGGRIASMDDRGIAEGATLPLLISDIHSLDEFMVSTGAYDHPDGPPAQPPPVPGEGDPVPDIGVDDATPTASPAPPGGESTPAPTAIP